MLKRASTRRPSKALLALIIMAAAALYLVGNGRVNLWDRDEPRYAQCSRQMLRGFPGNLDGKGAHPPDFIVPHFLDDLRAEKPPVIYWLQAGAMTFFGENSFAARFPSAMAMTLVLILLAVTFYRALGPVRATWAVFIMATSGLTIMSAKMCLTDATLLLWTTIAQVCAFAIYSGKRSWKISLIFWIALGIGGLTKGPIVLATLGATFVALAILDFFMFENRSMTLGSRRIDAIRWLRNLRPLTGLLIVILINAPWLYLVHRREPTFLPRLFGMLGHHFANAGEQHGGPPGFYLGMIWGLFFPWCLLLPTTLTLAWRNRRVPHIRYCLAMVIGIWVFQEIMKTKLPFYILPTFPALALLTADGLVRCLRNEYDDLERPIFIVAVGGFALCVLGMGVAPWLLFGDWPKTLFHSDMNLSVLAPRHSTMLLTACAVIFAVTVFILFKTRRIAAGAVAMGVGTMAVFAVIFVVYLPRADFVRTPSRIAALVPQDAGKVDALMIDYKEPSLAFYQGGTMVEEPANRYLEMTASAKWPTWIVLPRTQWEQTPAAIREQLQIVGEPVRGINYAGKIDGRQAVEILVLRKKDRVTNVLPIREVP